jgi:ATP-dependent Lon protease
LTRLEKNASCGRNIAIALAQREPELAMENGARRALIPLENRRQFLEVSGDVAERLDPISYGDAPVAYGDAPVAANKAMGIN